MTEQEGITISVNTEGYIDFGAQRPTSLDQAQTILETAGYVLSPQQKLIETELQFGQVFNYESIVLVYHLGEDLPIINAVELHPYTSHPGMSLASWLHNRATVRPTSFFMTKARTHPSDKH